MRLRITAVERYVLGQTLTAVAGAAAILSSVILLIDFVELSRQIGGRVDISFGHTLVLTLMKSPSTIVVLLPFMFLFGTLAAFVGLNRRSELVAMRAAGVSAWRFLLPAAAAAGAIGILTVAFFNPLTASLTDRFDLARAALLSGVSTAPVRDVWLRQGDDASQIVIHARQKSVEQGQAVLRGVSFYIYTRAASGDMTFNRRVEAAEARLTPGSWALKDVQEASPGAGAMRYDTLSIPTQIEGRRGVEQFASPNAVSVWRLPQVIRQTDKAGFSSTGYRLRFHQLLATPLLFAAMSILSGAFSLRLMRLGGLAALATSGVALGFIFFFFNQFSVALGQAELIPYFAAAWAPPMLALLSGLTLLCYTEDG